MLSGLLSKWSLHRKLVNIREASSSRIVNGTGAGPPGRTVTHIAKIVQNFVRFSRNINTDSALSRRILVLNAVIPGGFSWVINVVLSACFVKNKSLTSVTDTGSPLPGCLIYMCPIPLVASFPSLTLLLRSHFSANFWGSLRRIGTQTQYQRGAITTLWAFVFQRRASVAFVSWKHYNKTFEFTGVC